MSKRYSSITNKIPCWKMNFTRFYKASALLVPICVIALVLGISYLSASPSLVSANLKSITSAPGSDSASSGLSASDLIVPNIVGAVSSKRTITVSWQDVAGATNYVIAVRPANGTEPLEWVEYSALSSPHSISDNLVMSGLEYEVRVAAVSADGQSEWSITLSVSVPALQPAPSGAVGTDNVSLYYVGDIMAVNVLSQKPFENRSVWHWFVCETNETDCKLLPVPKSPTYLYHAPDVARGKLVKVQVDYDKDGTSYSATSALGVVGKLYGVPTEVEATVTHMRISVSWSEVIGATGYTVSIRPKNGVEPLPWSNYFAASSPYTVSGYWLMGGLEYEVRVTAFDVDMRSEHSQTVTIVGAERQSAPFGAVEVVTDPPYRVGDVLHVTLVSQWPFTARSDWHWFICNVNGTECKLLPAPQGYGDTYKYRLPEITVGKLLKVQADYYKDGVSYTATSTIGIVNDSDDDVDVDWCGESVSGENLFTANSTIESLLYALRLESVHVRWGRAVGGAVEAMCNDVLVATAWGSIALVGPNGNVQYLDAQVPMNLDELLAYPDVSKINTLRFKVSDILLRQHSPERWELFATHHYFTGECIRFRLSVTTILRDGTDIEVSPAWRTIFDAEPCLPFGYGGGHRSGGKMLTDGLEHLLVVIGDHRVDGAFFADENGEEVEGVSGRVTPQDPESHLGKLVRVSIKTGDTEILALGLRNPQGLTRDADSNLWSTEHGPLGGDELNMLEPGNNYGWPVVSYGIDYGGYVNVPEVNRLGEHEGFTKPILSWVPSIATSSLIVNDDQAFPLWRDDFLIASLDGSGNGNSLFRVRHDGTDIRYVERIKIGWRIRDLTQTPDGRIVLISDGGDVYFMSISYSYCADKSSLNAYGKNHVYTLDCELIDDAVSVEEDSYNAESTAVADGEGLFTLHCGSCHNLQIKQHGVGPHLVNLAGRRIGGVAGYGFSAALRSIDNTWTQENLEQFLIDPQKFAPGTPKSLPNLTDAEVDAIAEYIINMTSSDAEDAK